MKKVFKKVTTIFLAIIFFTQSFSEIVVSYAGSMENVIQEKKDNTLSGEDRYGDSRVVDISDEVLEKVDDETDIDLSVDGSSAVILQNIQMDREGEGVDMPEGIGKNSSFLKKVSTGSEPNYRNASNDGESNGDYLLKSKVELLESNISEDNGFLESHNTNPGVYLSESETDNTVDDLNSRGETDAKTGYKKLATSAINEYNYKTDVVYSERTLTPYQLLNDKKKSDVSFEGEEKRRENTEKESIIEEKTTKEETTEINLPEKKETEEESQEERKTEEKDTESDTTETSPSEKKETEEGSQEERETEEKSTEPNTTEIRQTEEESKTEEKNTETDTTEASQTEEKETEEETTEEIIKQESDIISGDTGEVTFTYDPDTATLKISGNGNMADYSSANNTPWYSYRTSIKNIVISSGVKHIGKYSFANMTEATNIEIPDTLLSIGHYAFYCDTAILNIDIPDNVEKIGYRAFYGCSSLESVTIPLNWNECTSSNGSTKSTDYCGSIFGNCQKLSKVSVPEGMVEIPSYAFSNCNYLVSVELPETMQVIKNQAFYGCLKLQDITIPNDVIDIQKSAFYNCRELANINFPEGIKSIGAYAFYNCSKLTEANLCDTIEKIGYQAFYGCSGLTSVTIPLSWNECPSSNTNGTINTSYCGCIFQGCNKLAEVTIPEGMTEIPSYGFNGCTYIETVNLSSTIKQINNHTFYNCSKLKNFSIPSSVSGTIGKSAFCGCSSLTEIDIPNGVTSLREFAFYECSSLTTVNLDDSIEKIGYEAFYNCTSLEQINIPKSWNECPSCNEDGAVSASYCGSIFRGCRNLTEIVIPAEITEIPAYAFANCDYLTTVHLPSGLKRISNHSFYNCSRLADITIPDSVVGIIGKSAFYGCALTEIEIPDGVKELKEYAFSSCPNLETVRLADSIEKIGYQSFYNCTKLSSVNIPLSWKECPSYNSKGAVSISYCGHIFQGCKQLSSITVPEGMEKLPDYAFGYCDYLYDIYLPDTLTNIGNYAFYQCSALTTIDIPKNIDSLGIECFRNCGSLRAVKIPSAVNEIGDYMFGNCSNLAAVSIPKGTETISKRSFGGCSSLKHVYYEGTSEQWETVNSNSQITTAVVSYGILCDYAEPTCILESSYTKPSSESYDSWYGGICNGGAHYGIDLDEVTFGPQRKSMFVSLPKDSYITYGFDKAYLCPDNTSILVTTTGVMHERGDFYALTTRGELIFIGTTYEDSEHHDITLSGIDDYIIGIKVVGRDLDGSSPGFDIVDIALVAKSSDMDIISMGSTNATIKRGDNTYNLFTEEQIYDEDSKEEATILVTSDWGDAVPGKVALVQNNEVKLENAGGSFVDIVPSEVFSINSSIFVVLLDADGQIAGKRKTKLMIQSKAQSRLQMATETMRLTVYQNENDSTKDKTDYKCSENAVVKLEDVEYKTSSEGIVEIPKIDEGTITVSKEGYIPKTITADQLKNSSNIYLQKKCDDAPAIIAVYFDDIDVLTETYSTSALSTETVSIMAEIDWGASSHKSIKIMQESKSVTLSSDGSLDMALSEKFDITDKIYIVVTDSDGRSVKRVLNIEDGTTSKVVKNLSKAKFEFSDNISITLPDNFKPEFFAGQKIKVGGLSTLIPVSVSAENGKVYAAIGLDLYNYENKTKNGKKETSTKGVVKNFINSFKDTGLGDSTKVLDASEMKKSIQKLKNIKESYKSAIKPVKGSFGFEVDFTVLGFAEGVYDENGKLTWIDGGIVANPSMSISKDFPFVFAVGPIPIPMYFETSLSADITAQLNVRFNEVAKNFVPNGEIKGDITLAGGIGVGMKKVLYASGGLEGKLKPDWKIYIDAQDYFQLKASLNMYVKAGIGPFEAKKSWDPIAEAVWIEYPNKDKNSVVNNDVQMYDAATYTLADLSYLEDGSVFLSDFADTPALGGSTMKTNIYRSSEAEYIVFQDGTKMAIWLDAEDNNANHIYLYYSYYDGKNWEEPRIIYDDGTMDYAPCVVYSGNTVFVAWQNATGVFDLSKELSAEDVAAEFDISVAVFGSNKKFITKIFKNSNLDMLPTLCIYDTGAYVAWINNSGNDWFGNNADNKILYSCYEGGVWKEPSVAYSGLNSVGEVAIDYNEGLHFAYTLDVDGDFSTVDDIKVFEDGKRVSYSDNIETSPYYFDHVLYWYCDGAIINSKIFDSLGGILSDRYQLIKIGDDLAAVYVQPNGLCTTLVISHFNGETNTWSSPVALTDGADYIGAFSASVDGDAVEVLYNSMEIIGEIGDEEVYGEATLKLISAGDKCDLTLSNVYYREDEFSAGDSMQFTVELINAGYKKVEETEIKIMDSADKVLASTILYDTIVPGESMNAYISLPMSEELLSQKVKFTAIPGNLKDANLSDNTVEILLGYEDVCVENITYGETVSGNSYICADIVNRGCSVRNNLLVSLIKDKLDGEVVSTKSINQINPLNISTVSFDVDVNDHDIYYIAITNSSDLYLGNDADFIMIRFTPDTEADIKHDILTDISIDSNADGTVNKIITVSGTLRLLDKEISSEMLQKEIDAIEWTSSDSTIAEVIDIERVSISEHLVQISIKINCHNEGTAIITGTTSNTLSDTCTVNVLKAEDDINYTVFFNTQGHGLAPEAYENIKAGSIIAPPTEPTEEGYTFTGWYKDADCTVLWDFAKDTVTSDVILYAGWKAVNDETDTPDNPDNPLVGDVLPEDIPADGKIPDGLWIAGVKDYTYTGKVVKPEVRVYDSNRLLKAGQDYTISYKNNTKANDASKESTAPAVVVKGKGNYTGTEKQTFKILSLDLNDTSVTTEDMTVAYNKKMQKKVPVLIHNGKKLANNKDFIVSYPDKGTDAYKATGIYNILLTAKQGGNFTGTRTVKFTITNNTLISRATVKRISNQTYTGKAIEPELEVTMKKAPLVKNTDYTVTYINNIESGTATAILTGIGKYAGTKKVTFKINGTSLKGADVSGITDRVYSGTAQEQKIKVTVNNKSLIENTDYEVVYAQNTNAGKATVTIKGIKAYSGTVKKTFKITAYDMKENAGNQIEGLAKEFTVKYLKGGSKPKLELTFAGRKLIEGTDYTLSCQNNKTVTAGDTKNKPTMTIKGKGNFKGSLIKTFTITGKALNDTESPVTLTVADKGFVDKAGKYISVPVLIDADGKKLAAGKDYEKLIVYSLEDGTELTKNSKVNAGTKVKVRVTGKGAYTGELVGVYQITQYDFNKAKISINPQTYTGKAVTLNKDGVTVKIGKETLTFGTDYEIVENSYVNNVKKGTASVTIVGKGNYGGTKTVKFKITARKLSWFWRLFG